VSRGLQVTAAEYHASWPFGIRKLTESRDYFVIELLLSAASAHVAAVSSMQRTDSNVTVATSAEGINPQQFSVQRFVEPSLG
jgi:hypothetical protein